MSLSKKRIKNIEQEKEKEKEKELESKILKFLERKKLTKTNAYAIWDIVEEIYNIKIEKINSRRIVEVGCAVCNLHEREEIIEVNVKNDEVTYYMAK